MSTTLTVQSAYNSQRVLEPVTYNGEIVTSGGETLWEESALNLTQDHRLDMQDSHGIHVVYSDNIVFAALPILERTWVESAGSYRTIHSVTRKTFIESASEYRRMAA